MMEANARSPFSVVIGVYHGRSLGVSSVCRRSGTVGYCDSLNRKSCCPCVPLKIQTDREPTCIANDNPSSIVLCDVICTVFYHQDVRES